MARTGLRRGGSAFRRGGAVLVATAALAGALWVGVPPAVSAASRRRPVAARLRPTLAHHLAERARVLARLRADVQGAATLRPADAATLDERLSAEEASIARLARAVEADTTVAQLRAARHAMHTDRVYSVMVPQVFDAIEASSTTTQVASLEANEASLEASVAALAGQATHGRATRAYRSYVAETAKAAQLATGAEVRVMAQVPANYPRDLRLFQTVSRHLLDAAVAVAHASYEASLVGLAAGASG